MITCGAGAGSPAFQANESSSGDGPITGVVLAVISHVTVIVFVAAPGEVTATCAVWAPTAIAVDASESPME